jgi:hypothetical protein
MWPYEAGIRGDCGKPFGVRIELLFWAGCPSLPEAQSMLDEVLAEIGVGQAVELREVKTQEQAETERFPGSPTIRVDGRDVDPAGAAGRPSLSCRVYYRPDGRVSPVPTREQLREALT